VDLLFVPLVMLILFGPVVVIALLANRAQRRTLEAMVPAEPAAKAGEPESKPVELRRVWSSFRLAVLRAVCCGGVLALPAAFLATGPSGLLREHVAWFVLAGHAALSVLVAWVAERWGALRDRPLASAALAGFAALVIMGAGTFQARATAEVFLGGGADKAFGELERLMSEPALFAATVGRLIVLITFTWAAPCAAITYGELRPRAHPVPITALLTFCAGLPACFVLGCSYLAASTLDALLPGGRPPGDA
jgi:hypothetical protein